MTLPEINAAIKSIKAGIQIVKGFNELKTEYEVKSATVDLLTNIIEVQNNLVAIQSEYQSLLDSKSKIEQELMNYKNWDTEKLNYTLKQIGAGVFAYIPKDHQDSPENQYYLCANCFDKEQRKSILQSRFAENADLFCPACKTIYRLPDRGKYPSHVVFKP